MSRTKFLLMLTLIGIASYLGLLWFPIIRSEAGEITLILMITLFGSSVALFLFQFLRFLWKPGNRSIGHLGRMLFLIAGSYLLILGFSPYHTHKRLVIHNPQDQPVFNVYLQGCVNHHAQRLEPGEETIVWIPNNSDCTVDIRYRSSQGMWKRAHLGLMEDNHEGDSHYEIGSDFEQLIE
ncbi:MAG: hypothetical protein LPK80_05645 [Bacteroidota bacterium]|nr:hypothetical protein [Bacteroidota bacterium]